MFDEWFYQKHEPPPTKQYNFNCDGDTIKKKMLDTTPK